MMKAYLWLYPTVDFIYGNYQLFHIHKSEECLKNQKKSCHFLYVPEEVVVSVKVNIYLNDLEMIFVQLKNL